MGQKGKWPAVAKSADVKHISHDYPLRAISGNWPTVAKPTGKTPCFGLLAHLVARGVRSFGFLYHGGRISRSRPPRRAATIICCRTAHGRLVPFFLIFSRPVLANSTCQLARTGMATRTYESRSFRQHDSSDCQLAGACISARSELFRAIACAAISFPKAQTKFTAFAPANDATADITPGYWTEDPFKQAAYSFCSAIGEFNS